jgi:hypothetical protein
MTSQQILLLVDSKTWSHEPGIVDVTARHARRVVAVLLTFANLTTTARAHVVARFRIALEDRWPRDCARSA